MENTTEKYLNNFNEGVKRNKHIQNRTFFILGEFVNMSTKILCQDKYGLVLIPPQTIIEGDKPSISSALNKSEYLVNRFKEIHGDKYDYSLVEYVNYKTKVKIICKQHGVFYQTPPSHLNGTGCPDCGIITCTNKRSVGRDSFLIRAQGVHKDTYEYDNIPENVRYSDKIDITCKIHGIFSQAVGQHLIGRGCRKCANETLKRQRQGQPNTWKLSGWYDKALLSNNFESYKFYILRFFNEDEEFIKCGITFSAIKGRYHSIRTRGGYKYEILKVVERHNKESFEDCEYIFNLEKRFHDIWKKYRYKPLLNFNGENECYVLNRGGINTENIIS